MLVALLAPLLLTSCSRPTQLERVLKAKELRVLTRNTATTYYEGASAPAGIEYDLAKGFADELGVRLKLVPVNNVNDVLTQLSAGQADFAAAGLLVTNARREWLRFTPPYQEVTPQLVYRLGKPKPADLDHLDGTLEVIANSGDLDRLRFLQRQHPTLKWVENRNADTEDLLAAVWQQSIDYTVADSNEVAVFRRFYPELRIAFDLGRPQKLAWAFRRNGDNSLYQRAVAYFKKIKQNGRLAQLLERYYGHVNEFDYVGTRAFLRDIRKRLPKYRPLFKEAAAKTGIDWRLLAAMAYQESHWNPHAVSPTGVRGIMMLTKATAGQLGIERRTDPAQSIEGGARYLKRLLGRFPSDIENPDRIWLATAAYNVGYGHLQDARIITKDRGGNPDHWSDVKAALPLLHKKRWNEKVPHGYARGREAVRYVENIRGYYDTLVWLTDQEQPDDNDLNPLQVASSP